MYMPMGAIFIWTTTSPNIIQKSKVSSGDQGNILTVIPCIIKSKLYASNHTVSQRKYPFFKGEDRPETILKPYSSMLSVWFWWIIWVHRTHCLSQTNSTPSLQLSPCQHSRVLASPVSLSLSCNKGWTSFHSLLAGNPTCHTLPGVLVTFLFLH